jgi:uroporphyrinogen III methyltransferase/synthase
MRAKFKVGARGSLLSVAQTMQVLEFLSKRFPGTQYVVEKVLTPGDRDLTTPIEKSSPDFFTRDLDDAVHSGKVDFAVHSAKDMPPEISNELDYFWLPSNEDRRDAWVCAHGVNLKKKGLKVGVSSERRSAYVMENFPNAQLLPIRGAIDSRVNQVKEGSFDAVIMAMAGINRLWPEGLTGVSVEPIPLEKLTPPEAQGYLAIVFRKGDKRMIEIRNHFVKAVRFVSAGVGNATLCTIAGMDDIEKADVVLYDDLLGSSLLPKEKSIHVGKRCGAHSMKQNEITKLICNEVRKGKRVVRLKGGDAGLFGRLVEETDALEELQIPFVVRPGVSALTAATTATGMLLTRRGECRGFYVETPRSTGTETPRVMFMAVNVAKEEADKLIASGMDSQTPCAFVFEAAGVNETVVTATLSTVGEVKRPKGNPPGLFIVGSPANKIWPRLGLYEGRKVLLTCSETIMANARTKVEDRGGRPIEHALIKLVASKDLKNLLKDDWYDEFDGIALTSPSAVRIFFEECKCDRRDLPQMFFTCGAGTDAELQKYGIKSDVVPKEDFSAKGLIEEIKKLDLSGKRILRLRSAKAGSEVAKAFRKVGAKVVDLVLYDNVNEIHPSLPKFDDVFFASASGVESFLEQYGEKMLKGKGVYVMGQPTLAALPEKFKKKAKIF